MENISSIKNNNESNYENTNNIDSNQLVSKIVIFFLYNNILNQTNYGTINILENNNNYFFFEGEKSIRNNRIDKNVSLFQMNSPSIYLNNKKVKLAFYNWKLKTEKKKI